MPCLALDHRPCQESEKSHSIAMPDTRCLQIDTSYYYYYRPAAARHVTLVHNQMSEMRVLATAGSINHELSQAHNCKESCSLIVVISDWLVVTFAVTTTLDPIGSCQMSTVLSCGRRKERRKKRNSKENGNGFFYKYVDPRPPRIKHH